MTMFVIPALLLLVVVPVAVVYVGLGGLLWHLGRRWDRRWMRTVARALAASTGGLVVALFVGNWLWMALDSTGGGPLVRRVGRWLTVLLVLLSLVAVVVPPIVAPVAVLLERRTRNRDAGTAS